MPTALTADTGSGPLDLPSLCLAITEHAPLPMATVEGATHILRYANPAFCRMMGKPLEALVGSAFDELLPEKDQCVTLIERVFRTKTPASYTEQEPTKPHPVFWSYTIWPVMEEQGLVGVMIQVTETAKVHGDTVAMNEALMLGSIRQHELTEAAENLNAQLRAEFIARENISSELLEKARQLSQKARELAEKARLLDLTEDAIIVRDVQGRISYWNHGAEVLYGWSSEEVLGKDSHFLLQTEFPFPTTLEQIIGELHRHGRWTGELVHTTRDGRRITVLVRKTLDCDSQGNPSAVLQTLTDISERKRVEAALRQNAGLFSTLVEHAPIGMYVVDPQFCLQQVNALAQPVFQAVHPLIGRDFSEVIQILWGPEVGDRIAGIFRHTLETGERYSSPAFTERRQDLGVEQSYDWETQRVTLPDGRHGVVCYFTDITERRRAEEALEAAMQAAEAANRSKDRFLAVLSHELRTPLTPVLMAVAALEHDPDLRRDVREDMTMIKRNIELEVKFIDDLLDVSRIASGKVPLKLEPLDLNGTVREVCADHRAQLLEQDVRLELELAGDVGVLVADATRLRQVISNVFRNAVKFTPAQGTIRVASARLSPDRCEVRVRDSGIGIPPETLPHIFEAFEQGDARVTRQFGGLGLGLTIAKALVEQHGGSIRAESAGAGQGATFIIELPGEHPVVAAVAQPAVPEAGEPARLRLLIVEDHADTARALSRLLAKAGFVVSVAGNVASALALAGRETFDLLISDLGLPDGTGCDVMAGLQKVQPLPGIAMSGYGMEEDVSKSREAGFHEHLVKPVEVPQLIAAIRRVMEPKP